MDGRQLLLKIAVDSGIILEEIHTLNGKPHRAPSEGPAIVKREIDERGRVTESLQEYRVKGRLHREDGPAMSVHPNSALTSLEEYHVNGRLHREDGPAKILFDHSHHKDVKTHEEYRINGRLHRDPKIGPAVMVRDAYHLFLCREEYFKNGKLHRDPIEGPAAIRRSPINGNVLYEEYWVDGKQVDAPPRPSDPRRKLKGEPSL
jgi:hypothetical protein